VLRSSESFAALTAALAKAQAKLVNPEKSLTATIPNGTPGEGQRTFRYAPLSAGLEIVRKTLSEHEIAVIQTTAIDQATQMMNLTTLLAHASGEWIASHWPVCAIALVANPHRMGAALTYARRYALFTLVGIAGEDDLDASDICVRSPVTGAPTPDGLRLPPQTRGNGRVCTPAKVATPAVLLSNESAALRDHLLAEIAGLALHDSAVTWAGEALSAKNTLTAGDAKLLEDAFEKKLSELSGSTDEATDAPVMKAPPASVDGSSEGIAGNSNTANQLQLRGIDKSALAVSAPRRYRDKDHLRYVMRQPCLLCARTPSDAHHLRFVQPRALGRKASDEFAVPLCRIHHRAAHRARNERTWWKATGIDPLKIARKLWQDTHAPNGPERPKLSLHAARTERSFTSNPVDSKAP
jgi:ERF superfamily